MRPAVSRGSQMARRISLVVESRVFDVIKAERLVVEQVLMSARLV